MHFNLVNAVAAATVLAPIALAAPAPVDYSNWFHPPVGYNPYTESSNPPLSQGPGNVKAQVVQPTGSQSPPVETGKSSAPKATGVAGAHHAATPGEVGAAKNNMDLAALDYVGPFNQIDCTNVKGLAKEGCEYMSKVGMIGMGANPESANSKAWIGKGGPNVFKFTNKANGPATLVMWDKGADNGFVLTKNRPHITYTLGANEEVVISVADGFSGSSSVLIHGKTKLNNVGQIANTWFEYTATAPANYDSATINVSREPFAWGSDITGTTHGDCTTDMQNCVFACLDRNAVTCFEANTYSVMNYDGTFCDHGDPFPGGFKSGGCKGWGPAGKRIIEVTLGGYNQAKHPKA